MNTLFPLNDEQCGAEFSPCRRFRYSLWRTWRNHDKPRRACFIGVNPSVANETDNDRTVSRCIRFARLWGYDGIVMLNAFAWVQTTLDMELTRDHVGAATDMALTEVRDEGALVIAAWGTLCPMWREDEIVELLRGKLHCLKLTKHGRPQHPLYIKASTQPMLFRG